MPLPHPEPRKENYRNEHKSRSGSIARNFVKWAVDITEYRNPEDDVNPAKNPTLGALAHDSSPSQLSLRLLRRLRRPVWRLRTELLCILRHQPLPASRFHRATTRHPADGRPVKKAMQHIKSNVPTGCAPRDKPAVDVVPQPQSRPATKCFELPPQVAVLKHFRGVGSRHSRFHLRARSHPRELHRSSRTQIPIRLERRPLTQVRRVGERLPHLFRQMAQFSDENQRPLLSALFHLRRAGRTRFILCELAHLPAPSSLIAFQLRQLYQVAAGVLEHRNRRAGHVRGLHRELRATTLGALVVTFYVVGEKHDRRLPLLEDRLLVRFGRRIVVQRQLQLNAVRLF